MGICLGSIAPLVQDKVGQRAKKAPLLMTRSIDCHQGGDGAHSSNSQSHDGFTTTMKEQD
jgi:hypothetical protein